MTLEEKRNKIKTYCDARGSCREHDCHAECPLFSLDEKCYEDKSLVEKHYELIFGEEPTATDDVINHPPHYCREDAMESIEEMVLVFGKEAVKHFCLCNVWKYRYRASSKNGDEDLHKSDWYMKKYKELCDDGTATGEQIPLPL
jgi:hypothetical protein